MCVAPHGGRIIVWVDDRVLVGESIDMDLDCAADTDSLLFEYDWRTVLCVVEIVAASDCNDVALKE
jgi:hypothetical protein